MGGSKKKSISAADRSQSAADSGQADGKKPEKKTAKEAKLAAQQAKQQALVAPKMDEKQLLKTLTPLKAITVYGTAESSWTKRGHRGSNVAKPRIEERPKKSRWLQRALHLRSECPSFNCSMK